LFKWQIKHHNHWVPDGPVSYLVIFNFSSSHPHVQESSACQPIRPDCLFLHRQISRNPQCIQIVIHLLHSNQSTCQFSIQNQIKAILASVPVKSQGLPPREHLTSTEPSPHPSGKGDYLYITLAVMTHCSLLLLPMLLISSRS
jgi:hypothetical protein